MSYEKNMIDFVKEQKSRDYPELNKSNLTGKKIMIYLNSLMEINKQSDFLDSQPNLGDFVPTNEAGEVMEEPIGEDYIDRPRGLDEWKEAIKPWNEALDRVLWKGDWEIVHKNPNGNHWIESGENMFWLHRYKTYEKLITSGVKLERIQKK